MQVIFNEVMHILPQITMLHYLTDSPMSQYRNASCSALVAQHKAIFNVDASWLYFKSRHGKGPCDGVGTATKRMTDFMVRKGRIINNAEDYGL